MASWKHLILLNTVKSEYNLKWTYLLYFKLIKSLPKYWIDRAKESKGDYSGQINTLLSDMMRSSDCRFAYKLFYQLDTVSLDHLTSKWESKLNVTLTENYLSDCFGVIQKCTIDNRTRDFQYKLIHRIITTKSFLYIIGRSDDKDALCSFCNEESETLEHLFFSCSIITKLRKKIHWVVQGKNN